MAVSPAQKLAIKKYRQENIEIVSFETKKGKRAEYKAAAAKIGIGQMEMIRRAIEEFIQNHAVEGTPLEPTTAQQALQATLEPTRDTLTAEEKTALNNLNRLPNKVQKAVLKLIAEINENQPTKGGD